MKVLHVTNSAVSEYLLREIGHRLYYDKGVDLFSIRLTSNSIPDILGSTPAAGAPRGLSNFVLLLECTDEPCFFFPPIEAGNRSLYAYVSKTVQLCAPAPVLVFSVCQSGEQFAENLKATGRIARHVEASAVFIDHLFEVLERMCREAYEKPLIAPCVRVVPATADILAWLRSHNQLPCELDPAKFEDLVAEIFSSKGFSVRQVGKTNRADGGVDLLMTSGNLCPLPIVVAVQIKYRKRARATGAPDIRDFIGAVGHWHPNMACFVSNVPFTEHARWKAMQFEPLLRLLDFDALREFLISDLPIPSQWAQIPSGLDLAPGLKIALPKPPITPLT